LAFTIKISNCDNSKLGSAKILIFRNYESTRTICIPAANRFWVDLQWQFLANKKVYGKSTKDLEAELNGANFSVIRIDLCREGIPVTQNLAMRAKEKAPDFEKYALLKEMLTDPDTEELVEEGGIMLRPKLADTLEVIRQEGGDALYTGSLSKSLVEDLRDAGSIITEEDMAGYTVKIEEVSVPVPLKDGMNLYSSPLPASGPTVEYILSLLNGILPGEDLATDFVKIVEAFKFGFGQRTKCGDPDFVDVEHVLDLMRDPEHIQQVQEKISNLATSQDPFYYGANFSAAAAHGTGNRVILAPNGDAVVLSSTINLYFGSFVVSPSTGILLNNEMDDFSLPSVNTSQTQTYPPSPANFIRPYKRPLSSMCPVIVLDENRDVRLAVGAAGSEKIITSVVLIAIMNLWYNKTLEEAVNYPRVHHQLYPMSATYEDGLSKDIVDALKRAGHKLQRLTDKLNYGSAATAVAKIDGEITAIDDFRRPGGFAGY
ncbi:unnamed protein product, partial [Bemisia tabaci]